MPAFDLGQNRLGLGGPDEGLGRLVVLGEVAVDGGLQVDQRVEDAALQTPLGGLCCSWQAVPAWVGPGSVDQSRGAADAGVPVPPLRGSGHSAVRALVL